jgi:hypothetical protein
MAVSIIQRPIRIVLSEPNKVIFERTASRVELKNKQKRRADAAEDRRR